MLRDLELKPICVLPNQYRKLLKRTVILLQLVRDRLCSWQVAEKEEVAEAAARIQKVLEVLEEAAPEEDEGECCPECGSTEFYATSYCNFAHCLECGAAINPEHEECWVPPEALRAEMAGDIEKAIRIMQGRGR
jgi:hypothetical protein